MTTAKKTQKISAGTVHKLPADLRKALISSPQALTLWEGLTPLAVLFAQFFYTSTSSSLWRRNCQYQDYIWFIVFF